MTEQMAYDEICEAAMACHGWYDGARAVVNRHRPDISASALDDILSQCGVRPPQNPDRCGYQGSMSATDYARLAQLLKETK